MEGNITPAHLSSRFNHFNYLVRAITKGRTSSRGVCMCSHHTFRAQQILAYTSNRAMDASVQCNCFGLRRTLCMMAHHDVCLHFLRAGYVPYLVAHHRTTYTYIVHIYTNIAHINRETAKGNGDHHPRERTNFGRFHPTIFISPYTRP